MIKTTLKVPKGIQYLSEWEEYKLPKGHIIVDKGVTGCGYTEYCLCNNENVVLCSPRKLLLENKSDQHEDDLNILYLKNEIIDFSEVNSMKSRIKNHLFTHGGPFAKTAIKFLVTYDSVHYLVEVFKDLGILDKFTFVVDEFQSIFLDSYFKSSVELDFVEILQECPNVLYLSATPMLDKYLERIPEFMNLNFQYLDWSETGYVENVLIERKRTKSLDAECLQIIQDFKNSKFPMTLDFNGQPVYSKEAVFYMNSVSEILRITKKAGLTPENTLIICSDTSENQEKLKKQKFSVGKVPKKGNPNPMFMFCTSAIYMGIDLYSDCATSYVFADPNVESLVLDISLDLPQIVGRQRNKTNPFKNHLIIFYKTRRKKGENLLSREEFDEAQKERRSATKDLLDGFKNLTTDQQSRYLDKLRDGIKVSQYSKDFISISKNSNKPVYNTLIDLANERAWEVAQEDYQDNISVTKAIQDQGYETKELFSEEEVIVNEFFDTKFMITGIFKEKLKAYCYFAEQYKDSPEVLRILNAKIKNPKFKMMYDYFGLKGCSAHSFEEAPLNNIIESSTKTGELTSMIIVAFKTGEIYFLKDIKQTLSGFYQKLGIKKTPKATDLLQYLNVSELKTLNPKTGNRDRAYKIL